MWWALLWAFIIGQVAAFDSNGGATGAMILAFLVIWYFASEAKKYRDVCRKNVEVSEDS